MMTEKEKSMRKVTFSELALLMKNSRGNGHLQQKKEFALFLGAGASRGSKIKTTEEMIKDFKKLLLERWEIEDNTLSFGEFLNKKKKELFQSWWQEEKAEKSKLGYQQWYAQLPEAFRQEDSYAVLFELCYKTEKSRHRYIENCIAGKNPSLGYFALSQLIEIGLLDTVITTNFDDLVYEACAGFGKMRPRIYSYGFPHEPIRRDCDRPTIIKLHGDYLYNRLINTYPEMEKRDLNFEAELRRLINEYELIVIGYGGNDDAIMKILEDGPVQTGVYWCVPQKYKLPRKVKNLLAERSNWFLVETYGFDHLMDELLVMQEYSVPPHVGIIWLRDTILKILESESNHKEKYVLAAFKDDRYSKYFDTSGQDDENNFLSGMQSQAEKEKAEIFMRCREIYTLAQKKDYTTAMEKTQRLSAAQKRDAFTVHAVTKSLAITILGLVDQGCWEKAIEALQTAKEFNENDENVKYLEGVLLAMLGCNVKALSTLKQLYEEHNYNSDISSAYAFALTLNGQAEEAAIVLIKALDRNPSSKELGSSLAFSYIESEKYTDAINVLRHYIKRAEKEIDIGIIFDLGLAYFYQNDENNGDDETAREYFRKAWKLVERNKEDIVNQRYGALLHLLLEKPNDAEKLFHELAIQRPKSVYVLRDSQKTLERLNKRNVKGAEQCLSIVMSELNKSQNVLEELCSQLECTS